MTRRRKRLPVRPGRCPAGGPVRRGAGARDEAQRGSATILVTLLVGLLALVAFVCVVLGGLLVGQRRAAAAADLAALAAAAAVQDGGQACAAAERVSAANAARLSACEVNGQEVQVLVQVDVPLGPSVRTALSARAKAGPVP